MSNQDFSRPVASPITVTSAASRGSPVGAASQCSWVDGRTLISFTPSRVRVSRELLVEHVAGVVAPHQHREPGPENVVEQHVLLGAGVDAGLREHRPDGLALRGGTDGVDQGADVEPGLGLVPALGDPPLRGGHQVQRGRELVPGAGDGLVRRGQDAAHRDGHVDHRLGVVAAFGVVGVQQGVVGDAAEHRGELPRQVGGVPDPGVVALALPDRHQVRGVPGDQHVALAERPGDPGVQGVDALPDEVQPGRVRHVPGEQLVDEQRVGDLLVGLVVEDHELEAADAVRQPDGHERADRVGAEVGVRRAQRVVAHVDDQEPGRRGLALEASRPSTCG